MNYKEKLYKSYVSTHILPGKGEITLDTLNGRAIIWEKTFGKFLPENRSARIIDLGCGYGSIVWWLQKSGFTSVQGIDVSAEQVETGRKLGVTNIEQADMKKFLLDKKSVYDVIFMRDLIEHLNKKDIPDILSRCYQALDNDGLIIIQAPNAESPFGGRIRYGDFTHEIAFTASSLSQLLRTAGFNTVRCYPAEPAVLGAKPLFRFILWKMAEAFYKFLLYVELGGGERIVTHNIISVASRKA